MTLATDEFIRRFLIHVLPGGFHRIRHYGLLANGTRKASLARVRELLPQPPDEATATSGVDAARPTFVCPHCGGPMSILETFARGQSIRVSPQQPRAP